MAHLLKLAACLAAICLAAPASSQWLWVDAGPPLATLDNAFVCDVDTVNDLFYVGGGNTVSGMGLDQVPLFCYNGQRWDTVGWFGSMVNAAVLYHDTLVVGGAFERVQGQAVKYIACYVGGAWHPYGDFTYGTDGCDIYSLRVIEDTLYAVGLFRNADGMYCNGLAKRVGGHWEPVGPVPQFAWAPLVYDIAKFQGKLVVSGSLSIPEDSICDVMQLVDGVWRPVGDNFMCGGFDMGGKLAVYKGELYLGCQSYYSSSTPGQGIMRWDGIQWRALGTPGLGLQVEPYVNGYPAQVKTLKVYGDLLYISGWFASVDLMPSMGVAIWDGQNYCIPDCGPHILAHPWWSTNVAVYHDSLYLSSIWGTGLTRYASTDILHQCSTLGIAGHGPAPEPLRVAWSPSEGLVLHGLSDGLHQVQVFDAQGRLVLDTRARSASGRTEGIALQGEGAALYMVVLDHERAVQFVRLE